MSPFARLSHAAVLLAVFVAGPAAAQDAVTFRSLDGATTLTADLHRPRRDGADAAAPRPAVVMLHGCSGLRRPDGITRVIYRAWARVFVRHGCVVLVVDSAGSRGLGATCIAGEASEMMRRVRPQDAYAALAFLQAQAFVRPDRVGVVGWSQGGRTVLDTINAHSAARPHGLAHDFKAAVALYPGACNARLQAPPFTSSPPSGWTTHVSLLVLMGEADNWTPAEPCRRFIEGAAARGAPVAFVSYPDAVHSFDLPDLPVTELPHYRTRFGVVPLVGTEPTARADALARVPAFLARHLGE